MYLGRQAYTEGMSATFVQFESWWEQTHATAQRASATKATLDWLVKQVFLPQSRGIVAALEQAGTPPSEWATRVKEMRDDRSLAALQKAVDAKTKRTGSTQPTTAASEHDDDDDDDDGFTPRTRVAAQTALARPESMQVCDMLIQELYLPQVS